MLSSQRNNVHVRYISYPRQATSELPHHPNHPYIPAINNHRSESLRQNSSRLTSTNQFTKLVRRFVNRRSSSGSNISHSSRSSSTRTQTRTQASNTLVRPPTPAPTSARTITSFPSTSSIFQNPTNTASTESEPFSFHNPWSVPSTNHASRDFVNLIEQESRPIQPLNIPRSSSRPPALSDLFTSYHSMDQQPTTSSNDDITVENNFHDPFNHHQCLTQNHSAREAFCFLSKIPYDDNYESKDSSFSSERRTNNNYECECEQEEQQKFEECYLCLESLEFRGGRMIINPGCGHLIHMKCYLEYTKYFKQQCTLCKKDFGSWDD